MQMTPNEAVDILDQAASAVPSNREGHTKMITAVAVLREFIAAAVIPVQEHELPDVTSSGDEPLVEVDANGHVGEPA